MLNLPEVSQRCQFHTTQVNYVICQPETAIHFLHINYVIGHIEVQVGIHPPPQFLILPSVLMVRPCPQQMTPPTNIFLINYTYLELADALPQFCLLQTVNNNNLLPSIIKGTLFLDNKASNEA